MALSARRNIPLCKRPDNVGAKSSSLRSRQVFGGLFRMNHARNLSLLSDDQQESVGLAKTLAIDTCHAPTPPPTHCLITTVWNLERPLVSRTQAPLD